MLQNSCLSWSCTQVKQHMVAATESQKHFVVWGSSIGWLVFYSALTYGVQSVGEADQAQEPSSTSTNSPIDTAL